MYVVVAYDIVDDRRRRRLAKAMTYYLNRVQKSVFEGELPVHLYEKMLNDIKDLIDHQTDRVRIYHLSKFCQKNTLIFGVEDNYPAFCHDEVI